MRTTNTNNNLVVVPCDFTNKTFDFGFNGKIYNIPYLETMPTEITLGMFEFFNRDEFYNLLVFFGEDILSKHVSEIKVTDFLQTDIVEQFVYGALTFGDTCVIGKPFTYTFTESKGTWHRHYQNLGYKYLRLSSYRTWASKLGTACLLDKFPWLTQFKFDFYNNSYQRIEDGEIYITVKEAVENKKATRSLYVPIKALIKNDYQLIEDRMRTYFGQYFGGPDRKKYLDEALTLLDSDEAKKLKEVLNSSKVN